jgi:predicted Zn-dependent protease
MNATQNHYVIFLILTHVREGRQYPGCLEIAQVYFQNGLGINDIPPRVSERVGWKTQFHSVICHQQQDGTLETALSNINLLLNQFPNQPLLLCWQGVLYIRTMDFQGAILSFGKARQINPFVVQFMDYYVFALYELKKSQLAVKIANELYFSNPESKECILAMALSCLSRGKLDESEVYLQEVPSN